MLDSNNDVMIVNLALQQKIFCKQIFKMKVNILKYLILYFINGSLIYQILVQSICESNPNNHFVYLNLEVRRIY